MKWDKATGHLQHPPTWNGISLTVNPTDFIFLKSLVGIVYDIHCVKKLLSPHVTDTPNAIRKLQTDIWLARCYKIQNRNVVYSSSDAPSGTWRLDEIQSC